MQKLYTGKELIIFGSGLRPPCQTPHSGAVWWHLGLSSDPPWGSQRPPPSASAAPVCPPGMAMGKGPISLSQALALRTSHHLLVPSLHPMICSSPCSLCPEAPGSVLSLHCDKYSHCPEVKTEPLEGKGTVPGLGNILPPHSMPARTGRGSGGRGHAAAGAAP